MPDSQLVPDATLKPRRQLASRSCDLCRQRKVRCDGETIPQKPCRECLVHGERCTYTDPAPRKRGPKTRNTAVEELKQKVADLEAKLARSPLQSTFDTSSESHSSVSEEPEKESVVVPQEAEEDISEELTERFRNWQICNGFFRFQHRVFASASNANLLKIALSVRERYLGRPSTDLKRPIYWTQFPWEKDFCSQRTTYVYPPRDLLNQLVELYFTKVHPTFPILHSNSFRKDITDGLHLTDTKFGAVVLAVLALASRHCDDPRVMVNGATLSSGWPFVAQVRILPDLLEPVVYDAQFYSLMTLYSLGGSTPHLLWMYLGLAVRVIQYRGHYIRVRGGPMKIEEELWNRAFWSVFILDGLVSSLPGRPPTLHLEEFDADPPLEVDDEYWENGFVQPLGKPSALSFFVHLVRLFEILAKAMRRLYNSKRLKASMAWTIDQEEESIAELDSLMNSFLNALPPHLRWDTANAEGDTVFFDQSALLHAKYYWLQLTIHRQAIQKETLQAEPSRFICLTAARSALGVADVWMSRSWSCASILLQNVVFVSAMILLLNFYAHKRTGVYIDPRKDLAQVAAATALLKACETRWQSGGRLWELIQELLSLDGHLTAQIPPPIQDPSDAVADGVEPGSGFRPGTSIEDLLSETEAAANEWSRSTELFDTELMSLWFAAPANHICSQFLTAWLLGRELVDAWFQLVEKLPLCSWLKLGHGDAIRDMGREYPPFFIARRITREFKLLQVSSSITLYCNNMRYKKHG
ncbi:fungal-specific transcription factor domain-containing protein [Roridomyces roridus]|uniref:Fungal-specific transcription factor domain-containing protein n=1 Tax=Roridomyces roridus TaxID=1738132 RepID=A0AAD7CKP5_9AGAR|nr:fungal-specific transcription factor domain-containing protein [Roridomyces roridus]